ncbi:MAG: alpha-L-fucosidase [Anaerolineae bacterium]|nr:alpha-L-fucosidase [Anaerolineae bacterium]
MLTAIPTPRQLEFQDWEFGLFLHFGIRTFYEGYVDWDGKPMSSGRFNPEALDCDQWMDAAKRAGMRYAVLTAKHHDGFANWPTRLTGFSVASSPWKDGRGDVVGEFVDACRRHGMHAGLYYSPADWHYPYDDPRVYNDYLVGQLTELLTHYGQIDILWFDGCGSEEREYDWPRITGRVRQLQPDVLVFNMGDPDYRWVGNEAGLAPSPCWNTADAVPFSVRRESAEALGGSGLRWLPAECDCRLRARNWFYSDRDEDTIKSLEELVGLYHYSVGRGCNLLLNVGPDRRGLLPDADVRRLAELGRELERRFGVPLAELEAFDRDGDRWTFWADQPLLIDHAVVEEDLRSGERVQRYAIEIWPAGSSPRGTPIVVFGGESIGHKAICPFPPVKVQGARLTVLQSGGPVGLRALGLYHIG